MIGLYISSVCSHTQPSVNRYKNSCPFYMKEIKKTTDLGSHAIISKLQAMVMSLILTEKVAAVINGGGQHSSTCKHFTITSIQCVLSFFMCFS